MQAMQATQATVSAYVEAGGKVSGNSLHRKTSHTLIHIEECANLRYLFAVDLGEFYIGVNANKRPHRAQSRRCGFAPFSATA